MVSANLLENAACRGKAPLFDVDTHHHDVLGKFNSCWLCEDCLDICIVCPVVRACWDRAVATRESYQICAGQMWTSGRPQPLHIGKRRAVKPKA